VLLGTLPTDQDAPPSLVNIGEAPPAPLPTAMQYVVEEHDTPTRPASPAGSVPLPHWLAEPVLGLDRTPPAMLLVVDVE